MSPKKKVIRKNDLTRRELPKESENLTPKQLFNRSVGDEHKNSLDGNNTQLKPTSAFVSLLIAFKWLICGGALFLILSILAKLV